MGFRRADLPEPPPAGWAGLGLKPGFKVLTVRTRAEADVVCRAAGVSAGDQFNKRLIASCVIPRRRQVILHDVSAADPVRMRALEDHEFPHTWGLVHKPSGREWLNPDGSAARPLTEAQAEAMRASATASLPPDPAARQGFALRVAVPHPERRDAAARDVGGQGPRSGTGGATL